MRPTWYVGVIKKTDKTAILQIRTDKDTLSPDIHYYMGEWVSDITPKTRVQKAIWLADINQRFKTRFSRLIVDGEK